MDVRSNLVAWRLFVSVAREKGLARAAESLDLDAGRASRLLRDLERAVGIHLLNRASRPIELTKEGEALLPYATSFVRSHEELLKAARTVGTKLNLKIGVPVNIVRKEILEVLDRPALKAFLNDVRIVPEPDLTDLRAGKIDLSIIPCTPKDEDLYAFPICKTCTVGLVAPSYLEKFGSLDSTKALSRHRFIVRAGGYYPRIQTLECGRSSVPFSAGKIVFEGELATCRELTVDGSGICFDLSLGITIDDILAGRLVPVLTDWHRPHWSLNVIMLESRRRETRLRLFAQLLASSLSHPLEQRTRRWYQMIGIAYPDP